MRARKLRSVLANGPHAAVGELLVEPVLRHLVAAAPSEPHAHTRSSF